MPAGWEVTTWSGPAADLHGRELPADGRRHAWVLEPTRPALVLGSTQPDEVVDAAALDRSGIDRVRRRSGGGAVLLVPGRVLWIDVVVPREDPLWREDVGASFAWLGHTWQAALAAVGVAGTVHAGPLVRRRWGKVVCFAGLGAGEVVAGERKVVGLSQRRTRTVARFQSVVEVGEPDVTLAAETVDLLVEPADPATRTELRSLLIRTTAAVPVAAADLRDAFLTALPVA